MISNFWQNYGGYVTAPVVWFADNWSTVGAFIMMVLQGVYMIYKIKKARRDVCEDGE